MKLVQQKNLCCSMYKYLFNPCGNSILFPKLFWPTLRKNCSCDWEKLLKLEAKVREFFNFWRSLEQLIWTVKRQNNFRNTTLFFSLLLEVSQITVNGQKSSHFIFFKSNQNKVKKHSITCYSVTQKFSVFRLKFQKFFSITRTYFSHSRSEQFW